MRHPMPAPNPNLSAQQFNTSAPTCKRCGQEGVVGPRIVVGGAHGMLRETNRVSHAADADHPFTPSRETNSQAYLGEKWANQGRGADDNRGRVRRFLSSI